MQFRLVPHPHTPCEFIRSLTVNLSRASASDVTLAYRVDGDIARLRIPPPRPPLRTDGLWRETCFEAFFRPDTGSTYSEFNFAPSRAWAAYRFSSYRQGMRPVEPLQSPLIACTQDDRQLQVNARLHTVLLTGNQQVALTAVLQDAEGQITYWALAHAPGGKPDFHNAYGFAATLAAQQPGLT